MSSRNQSPLPTTADTSPPQRTTRKRNISVNTRVRLSANEKAQLLQLCILHQQDHRHGNKKAFWVKIRGLLRDKLGKELKDPQQTVDALVRQRERLVAIGMPTVQGDEESGLKSLLGVWIAHLNKQQLQSQQPQQQMEVEKDQNNNSNDNDNNHKTKQAQENLPHPPPPPPPLHSEPDTDCDTDIDTDSPPQPPPPSKHHKPTHQDQTPEVLSIVRRNGERIVTAVEKLADALSVTSSCSGRRDCLEERVARLEEAAGETNRLLKELLRRQSG